MTRRLRHTLPLVRLLQSCGLLMFAACGVAPPPEATPRAIAAPREAAVPDSDWASLDFPLAAAPSLTTAPAFAIDLSSFSPQEPQEPEPYANLYKTFGLTIGGAAYDNFDTSLRVDSDNLVGGVLDLEDTLGVDDSSTVVRIDSFYNFNKYHGINLSYYDIRRDGSRAVLEDIDFGNVSIPLGSEVKTEFDTKILKLAYRYNFVADYRTAIGASFGFHTMQFETSLNAANISVSEEFKATVPLPVLGLHFEYALSPTWKLLTSVEVLQVDIGSARGFLSDQRLTIEHNPFHNFGWGLGYNGFDLEATIEGEGSLTGRINYDFAGLLLFARWYL